MNDTRNQNLLNLINRFLNSIGGFTLTKDEFYDVKAALDKGKIHAIKHLRHVTRIKEEAIFELDLGPRSSLTRWAVTNDIDLRTGEVKERVLGLKDAKDTIEFIELNQ